MRHHLNTLFITTQGTYLSKDGESVDVLVDRERKVRIPIITLGGIVCFGRVSASPALMGMCAERGVAMTYLTEHGRFLARVSGFTPGNVNLRREQYRRADDPDSSTSIARQIVSAKIANARTVLLRAVRDHPDSGGRLALEAAARRMSGDAVRAQNCQELDVVRGVEGESAATYFGVFDHLIVAQRDGFSFRGRTRRPPMDTVNALISFLYTLLMHDTRAVCEASGLDAAVGFLHRDRPGRPGLALDLMEEFRSVLADRLAMSLINRQQVSAKGFQVLEGGGGVVMDDATRKVVLVAYQERKQEVVTHAFLDEKTTVGLLPHLQARLLARHLRGDLDAYPPLIWK